MMNLEEKVSSLETKITMLNCLLQHAVRNVPVVAHNPGSRFRIPEPKAYGGAHGAKEVENFLFEMEQYFFAANVEDEARKRFIEYNASRALQKLEHTGSVQNYVKAFSALMLDIRDMSEKDKLFTFMESLKLWARLELQRQRVINLGSAMATAECLVNFNPENQRDRQTMSSPI
ncbi:UNVERIFIED_CONTAM: hypothetical protein Scaly_0068600 [Sesamum calycinum]|uniref:Retrotransposon gag domain-containing protein n=1 Tax=Sesamum calycinum TaxID=2727403 RepID=A0AAW2SVM3_9LAMI